jgi:hypothetical protein
MTGDIKVAEGCVVVRKSTNNDGSQRDTVVADWYQAFGRPLARCEQFPISAPRHD